MKLKIRKIRPSITPADAKAGYMIGLSLTAIGAIVGLFWALSREEKPTN